MSDINKRFIGIVDLSVSMLDNEKSLNVCLTMKGIFKYGT